jgi:hypothetical protein
MKRLLFPINVQQKQCTGAINELILLITIFDQAVKEELLKTATFNKGEGKRTTNYKKLMAEEQLGRKQTRTCSHTVSTIL